MDGVDKEDNIYFERLYALQDSVLDIVLIYWYYRFSWAEVLDAAHKKAGFADEDLVIRLKSFPQKMLEQIKYIDSEFLNDFGDDLSDILHQIVNVQR